MFRYFLLQKHPVKLGIRLPLCARGCFGAAGRRYLVHLAQLLAEKALGIGHNQAGRSGEGLVDDVLLGIVALIWSVTIGRDVGVGQDGIALAVLLRVGDADRVVDLVVEPDAVVDDGVVIDEVITAARR